MGSFVWDLGACSLGFGGLVEKNPQCKYVPHRGPGVWERS